jgi:exodeoxyribonuclease VII large subunit
VLDTTGNGRQARVWPVGALCRAIADALEARFNPVSVAGEISGFSRAASGHCYFSLKDANGQLRCAMFRRAATLLDFNPRDGELVEVRGRLGVYEPRGDLQLIVESMSRAGQGSLFEQFLQLKAKLEAQGLFDAARKRPLPAMPRAIGLVTSLGAAALHDVAHALQRRVPHIPVVLAPSSVQGQGAAAELVRALQDLYAQVDSGEAPIDVILLVRGGGALEDLWAFNDEQLAHTIAQSPVPIVSGVGHETDFTIADFVADLRAPTPTAAAELVSDSTESYLQELDVLQDRLRLSLGRYLEREAQMVDHMAARIGRPSGSVGQQQARLAALAQTMGHALHNDMRRRENTLQVLRSNLPRATQYALQRLSDAQARAALRLQALDPALILQRGYAWLTQDDGKPVTSVGQIQAGQQLAATLADGTVDVQVRDIRRN